jgi:UDP-glucose 4-epimerase
MIAVIFGSSGFVGLNLTEALLADGHDVIGFDRRKPPEQAMAAFGRAKGRFNFIEGDVTDAAAVGAAIPKGADLVVMAIAITAGSARDAADPETILAVNLMAQIPILRAAKDASVKRVINVSSVAAYGASGDRFERLDEDTKVEPVGLYAITKYASERVGARLGDLWDMDVVSVRLSALFGPWEHDTGFRDTLSPQYQVLEQLLRGEDAILARPGERDWIYAVDVAEALIAVASAPSLPRRLYNVSTGRRWSVLDWGQHVAGRLAAAGLSSAACRLAAPGEAPTIDLFGASDRASLTIEALAEDTGWRARFDASGSADHLASWLQRSGRAPA